MLWNNFGQHQDEVLERAPASLSGFVTSKYRSLVGRPIKNIVGGHKYVKQLSHQVAIQKAHAMSNKALLRYSVMTKQKARNIAAGLKLLDKSVAKQERLIGLAQKRMRKSAIRLGTTAVITGSGLAAANYARKAYKARRAQQARKKEYRQYNVYPEHGYTVAPIQRYNEPYYDSN